jgi:polar amino acid transport system substrate-binding protein/cystine transport system substrate-binding protein/membrane-bound lytic murein transglycosylase F
VLPYLCIFGLLGGVSLLPPDTSLREVRSAGVLRACMPPRYPPLVTGDAAAPGIDVELLTAIAKRMGLTFDASPNAAMGRDFNPRNWRVTRAQCDILAGGVVTSPMTKSFLETSPPYAQTGWAFVLPHPTAEIRNRHVGVFAGISGLDRLALSRYLRAQNAEVTIAADAPQFTQGLRDGRFEIGVTERLLALGIGSHEGWRVVWAPPELPRYPLAFGLWKGDLTLKRAVVAALDDLQRTGEVSRIVARYLGEAASGDKTASSQSGDGAQLPHKILASTP